MPDYRDKLKERLKAQQARIRDLKTVLYQEHRARIRAERQAEWAAERERHMCRLATWGGPPRRANDDPAA